MIADGHRLYLAGQTNGILQRVQIPYFSEPLAAALQTSSWLSMRVRGLEPFSPIGARIHG